MGVTGILGGVSVDNLVIDEMISIDYSVYDFNIFLCKISVNKHFITCYTYLHTYIYIIIR